MPAPALAIKFSWVGPLALSLGILGAHWVASVPSAPMLLKNAKGSGPASGGKGGKATKKTGREARAFLGEQRDVAFDARHRPALAHAYEIAAAYVETRDGPLSDEAAATVKAEPACGRWRCQLQLCGPRKRVRAVVRVMRDMDLEDDSLWDAFESAKPVKQGESKRDPICIRTTVRFSRPGPEHKGMRVAKRTMQDDAARAERRAERAKKKKKKKKKKPTPTGAGTATGSSGGSEG